MQIIIVFSMVFSVLIALFAVQNAEVVTISLLWYHIDLSQAVVILGSALIGVLIMLPFDVFRGVRNRLKLMDLQNEIKKLRDELEKSGHEAETPPVPTLEALAEDKQHAEKAEKS